MPFREFVVKVHSSVICRVTTATCMNWPISSGVRSPTGFRRRSRSGPAGGSASTLKHVGRPRSRISCTAESRSLPVASSLLALFGGLLSTIDLRNDPVTMSEARGLPTARYRLPAPARDLGGECPPEPRRRMSAGWSRPSTTGIRSQRPGVRIPEDVMHLTLIPGTELDRASEPGAVAEGGHRDGRCDRAGRYADGRPR